MIKQKVVGCLPNMRKALGPTLSLEKKKVGDSKVA
jgi:hypothetical protein